ncbi:iron donor protein CyaY [Edhazardia aedis USNM 41457]|uniref:Iron donor protein CyaY n=1 Tax=Edhazardia aedis (strain USNM 41457) TaxID=1003232 RepID=J9DRP8_EDHAE|nr:iron donor protein CyaY [Edhazardia aedis USNM 41457]|eukprot:EJW03997.1 iron donor protein CyaY [Edhazardia aedis USNM 41457]
MFYTENQKNYRYRYKMLTDVKPSDILYKGIVEKTLHKIYEIFDSQPYKFDLEHEEGVLSFKIPKIGEYVLNRQPPVQQLWISSPITGPKKFRLDKNLNFCGIKDNQTVDTYILTEIDLIKKRLGFF